MRTRSPNHRRPVIRDFFEKDISVDCFAGCGGASHGTAAALGRPVDIAINHDPVAIAVHEDNSPHTEHYRADIFSVDPVRAVRGRHVRHLHASPDCRHHSRASGGAPKSASVRALADVVPKWARAVRPDCITLENVPEFIEWGPLNAKGKPIKARRGEFFRKWQRELESLGYVVEHRVLHAHHYGAHTSRKRLYLVARCDGEPIVWPAPTHGPGKKKFRTAAECIDWSIPCPSIFERKKKLADATLRRVAAGIARFVLNNPKPFIVTIDHQSAQRGDASLAQPLSTITRKARHVLITPTLVHTAHGEVDRNGKKRGRGTRSVEEPIGTICASGTDYALAAATLATFRGTAPDQPKAADIAKPLGTISAGGIHAGLVAASMVQTSYGEREGQAPRVLDLEKPLGTVVAGGQKHALVAAFLSQFNLGQIGHELTKPIPTITAIDHHALVRVRLAPPEFAAQYPNARAVLPFLVAYYGSEGEVGQQLSDALRTITTRDRFALVTVVVGGEEFAIVDIGLRMLEPHELLKAQFGKHAKGFKLDKALTKKDQVRLIGNSVVPVVMEAIVRANLGPKRARPSPPRARAA